MVWNYFLSGIIQEAVYFVLLLLLIVYRKKLNDSIQYIIAAIGITFLIEFTSFLLRTLKISTNSVVLYVVGIVGIVYGLYLFYFYRITKNPSLKKVQFIFFLVSILNFIFSIFFIKDFFTSFPDITNFINIILLFFSVALFLNETFNSDKVLNIKMYYPFFVATGLIIVYVGLVPILFFSKRIVLPTEIFVFNLLRFLIIIFGYGIMILGIYFSRKKKVL